MSMGIDAGSLSNRMANGGLCKKRIKELKMQSIQEEVRKGLANNPI